MHGMAVWRGGLAIFGDYRQAGNTPLRQYVQRFEQRRLVFYGDDLASFSITPGHNALPGTADLSEGAYCHLAHCKVLHACAEAAARISIAGMYELVGYQEWRPHNLRQHSAPHFTPHRS